MHYEKKWANLPRKNDDNFLSVRVDDGLYALIVKLADQEERPLGAMARILLREGALAREQEEKEPKKK